MTYAKTRQMDWQSITHYVNSIHYQLNKQLIDRGQRLKTIIGLARGGLIPAVMLSHRTGVPMVSLQWQTRDGQIMDVSCLINQLTLLESNETILIIDDIVDSGLTFNSINSVLGCGGINNAIFACIIKKTNPEIETISGVVDGSDHWITFPWELESGK